MRRLHAVSIQAFKAGMVTAGVVKESVVSQRLELGKIGTFDSYSSISVTSDVLKTYGVVRDLVSEI